MEHAGGAVKAGDLSRRPRQEVQGREWGLVTRERKKSNPDRWTEWCEEWQDEMKLGTSMRHKILNPGVNQEHAGGCWLGSHRRFIQAAEASL